MKWQEVEPVAHWTWWWVLAPFGLAILWWEWADATGYTKRKAVERENERIQERIDEKRKKLGFLPRRRR